MHTSVFLDAIGCGITNTVRNNDNKVAVAKVSAPGNTNARIEDDPSFEEQNSLYNGGDYRWYDGIVGGEYPEYESDTSSVFKPSSGSQGSKDSKGSYKTCKYFPRV